MKKVSLTIGIPVYNEEKNIKRLLHQLAQQNVTIEKTIVVNDGSTDKTINKINELDKSIKEKLNLKVINLDKNMGKAYALNIIFKQAQSKYLVLLDSDIWLPNSNILEHLLKCMDLKDNIGLVCGWYEIKILNPFDIVGRAYRFSSIFLKRIAQDLNNIYGATGAIMLLSEYVYTRLILPEKITRVDAYIYLYTLSLGKKFIFCPEAKVIISLYDRESLKRFIHRQARCRSIPKPHLEAFPHLAQKEFREPELKVILKSFLCCFSKYPIDGIIWIILKIISYSYRKFRKIEVHHKWRTIEK